MFVEGTLRWQITEDSPWDLLLTLALRDLAGLTMVGDPVLPAACPTVATVLLGGWESDARGTMLPARNQLERQWLALFSVAADRQHHRQGALLQPPHFGVLDRALELQDLVIARYEEAACWAGERAGEYARTSAEHHALRAGDIVDVVHQREHELRRQAGYFRLDIDVLPLAEPGAWVVGPHTVVVSASLRDDSSAFREWLRPVVAALV